MSRSAKPNGGDHENAHVEIEVNFGIRSICDCCSSELEWRKEFVEIETSLDIDHIKLWFESGEASSRLRRLLQTGIPPVSYLRTLRSPKKRASRGCS
jgi:hypothetical protein